jgi:hypothetical protein
MLFPTEIIPIRKWCAYRAKLPPGSNNKHRIIIIYKHLTEIKYFYVTSQVEKVRKKTRDDISSVVELNSSDWDVLTKDSCIQCNDANVYEINEDEFKHLYKSGEMDYLGEIPEKVKNAIISAICMSCTFTEIEKVVYTTE